MCAGSQLLSVLNAFRHHGVSRPPPKPDVTKPAECSTPFGITEFRGPRARANSQELMRAQRLSASRSFAGYGFRALEAISNTCSTPFGITEFRGPEIRLARGEPGGAQRLSASRSFAGGSLERWHDLPCVLNAFRHHGVSRVDILPLSPQVHVVLNAFRHHGVSRLWQASS